MTLLAAEGVLAVVAKAAQADPEGARELVRLALYESMVDQLAELRPQLERDLAVRMSKSIDDARRAVVRGYINKRIDGEEVDGYLQQAANLTVLDSYVAKAFWRKEEHPRDPSTGRFTRRLQGSGAFGNIDDRSQRNHEAGSVIDEWRKAGLANDNTRIIIQGKRTDEHGNPVGDTITHRTTVAAHQQGRALADVPEGFRAEKISLDPNTLAIEDKRRLAALDAMAAFTSPATAGRIAGRMPTQEADAAEWANDWDQGGYRRLRATGQLLAAVSAPGSAGATVGGVAALVGEMGPVAERVLGPGLRRTAYRYRGTEVRPDAATSKDLDQLREDKVGAYALTVLNDRYSAAPDIGGRGQGREVAAARAEGPVRAIKDYYSDKNRLRHLLDPGERGKEATDALELQMRGDVTAAHLLRRVPDVRTTKLNFASGQVPPSRGIMLDADGDIVSEAVGYEGDHYLPFDLKNLFSLHGGQYVRTRVAGGPTNEDIYTGLLSGARQVQVVSNSGVFTMEFDPDMRGGRRYSDKAAQMVGRYQELLAAAANPEGTLYQRDLDTDTKRTLMRDAFAQMGETANEDDIKARYDELVRRERLKRSMESSSDEEIDQAARSMAEQQAGPDRARMSRRDFEDLVDENRKAIQSRERDTQVKRFQLDGDGYAAAMRSLQTEFPQYIRRVDYKPLDEFQRMARITDPDPDNPRKRPGPDRGLVPAGYVRPRDMPYARGDGRMRPGENQAATAAAGGAAGAPGAARSGTVTPAADASVKIKVIESTPLERLASDENSPAVRAVADTLTPTLRRVDDLRGGKWEEPEVSDSPDNALTYSSNITYAKWLINQPNLQTNTKLASFLASNPRHAAKAVKALHEIDATIKSSVAESDPLRQEWDTAAATRAASMIEALVSMGKPWADGMPEEPALAKPDEEAPRPLKFPEIAANGSEPANYEAYLAGARNQNKELASAIDELAQQGDVFAKDGVPAYLAREIDKFNNTREWGARLLNPDYPASTPPRGEVVTQDPALARELAVSGYQRRPEYRRLENLQKAYAFLHSRAIANAVVGGGDDEGPKGLVPIARRYDPEQVRKVLLHPPGSPMAVALSKALRENRHE